MNYLSLFSGMEAAHLAWSPLGWKCRGVAEIEPAACQLLDHRLPHVPNLGSVTEITDAQIAALGPLDVVIGGSPCQDLSVAGKRAGLAGARSGLFHEQLRIFHAARTLCGARWLVWENVPGAFSSHKGRDFALVVGELAGCDLDVPADGWGSEGVALGDHGLVEWSVLDAQWFGVAQRRRRVFAILDTGDWAGRRPVLLEPESLRGDSPPRREAGKGVATRTPCGLEGGELARALTAANTATGRLDPNESTEDGTGRGTPLVPVAFAQNQRDEVRTMDVAGALAAEPGAKQQTYLQAGMAVRRLTPRECERLQGAPDDWTLVPNKHGKTMADGPRYKMLGNSFAVPVIRWIGERLEAVS